MRIISRAVLGIGNAQTRSGSTALPFRRAPAGSVARLTQEQDRWAEASVVHRLRGVRASVFVAERIGALALAVDEAGIARWTQITARLDTLMTHDGVPQ